MRRGRAVTRFPGRARWPIAPRASARRPCSGIARWPARVHRRRARRLHRAAAVPGRPEGGRRRRWQHLDPGPRARDRPADGRHGSLLPGVVPRWVARGVPPGTGPGDQGDQRHRGRDGGLGQRRHQYSDPVDPGRPRDPLPDDWAEPGGRPAAAPGRAAHAAAGAAVAVQRRTGAGVPGRALDSRTPRTRPGGPTSTCRITRAWPLER